ncbi:MAG: M17 family metallopeptidase [Candidatus Woesearchaeota archaeon]
MNTIQIIYNQTTQKKFKYMYSITLISHNVKEESFHEPSIGNYEDEESNSDIKTQNNIENKLTAYLQKVGAKYDEIIFIPPGIDNNSNNENENNDSLQIIGITQPQITFRKISSLVSQIISKVSNLKQNDESLVTFDMTSYSQKLQHLIISAFEYENYSFKKYLQNNKEEDYNKNSNNFQSAKLNIITSVSQEEISTLKIVSNEVSYCRDLVNSNACEITCEYLHKEVEEFSKKHNLEFKAVVGEELLKENMNLHYQVGKAAQIPPRMLYLVYRGDEENKSYSTLVGKGITFDTGGLNLKPTGAIEDMKLDMGGAAATLSAFKALVEMRVKKNIILVLACAENAIDSKSYKPGDVFISRKGISVEITNTDAEGRLVLADCMDYIQDKFEVKELIDCATLTGASMIALGLESIAMFSNDNSMARRVYQCSKDSYELMWRLPIFEEHREVLKSTIANCSNCGSGALRRFGGASSAAAFLEQFVKSGVKWVHLDIAGASFSSKRGASGCAVRTLVEYLK